MADDSVVLSPTHFEDAGVVRDEKASEAFTPGELLEIGGSNDVQKHSTAGGTSDRKFALPASEYGGDKDTDYSSGETAKVISAHRGAKVDAVLGTGTTEVNISEGDLLESAGDGTLQLHGTAATGDSENIVAIAREAKDNSGGASEVRIEVEVL